VQAAIAAVHDEAATDAATDWPQILALYEVLEGIAPGPSSRSTARSRSPGSTDRAPGSPCSERSTTTRGSSTPIVSTRYGPTCSSSRATGPEAREAYLRAARRAGSLPEQRYLAIRAARLN
jgi:predicted RNA polymerase sigma factor